ncbi:hypothetical protein L1987_29984 [Smallanthus sonchifolius]|uniref:Uncharacterized protein n=1 Tax=Smallanthus sonchifolius TaxID=185202 RepID=A0ACB9I481_9ASTR|nr:hypothetical protein L1987_29984 [Smallanthus sonchifolius]
MSQRPLTGGNDDGGDEQKQPNSSQLQTTNKKSRNPEVNKNRQRSTSSGQRSTSSNLLRGTTNIFYKTRLCQKFANGKCTNGDKCTFAHGPKDLREPPPNWQELVKDNRGGNWNDDEKIIQRMRICRNFYNGENCPYGEKCTFLHQSPDKFKVQPVIDNGKTGESSVIKVETVVDQGQSQTMAGQDSVKTGGLAELQPSDGANSSVAANAVPGPITTEPLASGSATAVPAAPPRIGRGFLKLANKKLVGIYADWISDGEDDLN